MYFGGHIGFLAAILNLRQNLTWPRSVFQIVWSEVHEYTEKALTGKRAVFTWHNQVRDVRYQTELNLSIFSLKEI